MKKILISLLTIAVVGAMIGAGATAYFSDTETSNENTFEAGTIDFEMTKAGTSDPVEITMVKMKPCDWFVYKIRLHNLGNNDGPVYLHLKVTDSYGGDESEPEIEAEKITGEKHDIENKITVDLVALDPNPYVIICPQDHIKLGWLDCKWIPLGYFGGEYSAEKIFILSFHLQADTGNEYQGDGVKFLIEAYMTDHNDPGPNPQVLFLENKDANWRPIGDDGTYGWLKFNPSASTFDYKLRAYGLQPGQDYSLIYYPEPQTTWPWPVTVIGGQVAAADGSINLSGSYDFGQDLNQVKLWVVLTNDIVAGKMSGWNPSSYLFETVLVNYDDTDVP